MTKAERIRALYKTGQYTTGQIADVVGCLPEYVRVVARQRMDAEGNFTLPPHHVAWCQANPEKIRAYDQTADRRYWRKLVADPVRHEAYKARQRIRVWTRKAEGRAS